MLIRPLLLAALGLALGIPGAATPGIAAPAESPRPSTGAAPT